MFNCWYNSIHIIKRNVNKSLILLFNLSFCLG